MALHMPATKHNKATNLRQLRGHQGLEPIKIRENPAAPEHRLEYILHMLPSLEKRRRNLRVLERHVQPLLGTHHLPSQPKSPDGRQKSNVPATNTHHTRHTRSQQNTPPAQKNKMEPNHHRNQRNNQSLLHIHPLPLLHSSPANPIGHMEQGD